MKKKVMALLAVFVLLCAFLTGCTEVYKVSNNISQEADNFNVTRKLTVLNARTDTILLELTGTFSLQNNSPFSCQALKKQGKSNSEWPGHESE